MRKILLGDCLEKLKELEDNSVDSIVTDPPAGISFMGREWDSDKGGRDHWIKWMQEVATECKRVLKPGGHAFVWAIPRTSHWTATAWENAGFEIRDVVAHIFGSGFPKSHNVEKAVQKIQPERSNEFKGIGTALKPAREDWILMRKPLAEKTVAENCLKYGTGGINIDESRVEALDGGWKPTKQCNISSKGHKGGAWGNETFISERTDVVQEMNNLGRFPANLIHDNSEEVRECFPETKSGSKPGQKGKSIIGSENGETRQEIENAYGDSGNASRFFKSIYRTEKDIDPAELEILDKEIPPLFFDKWKEINELYKNGDTYEDLSPIEEFIFNLIQYYKNEPKGKSILYFPKASKSERNKGCENIEEKQTTGGGGLTAGFREDGSLETASAGGKYGSIKAKQSNNHPTVKPIALMEYLIKMVTPKGGVVLDPFAGSGSTLVAAKQNGFQYIGIEKESEYIPIIEARLNSCN